MVRRGGGRRRPEAESFLRIEHPMERANWPHVHVLNEINCNFGERGHYGLVLKKSTCQFCLQLAASIA